MMIPSELGPRRRRTQRVATRGGAVVHAAGVVVRGHVDDLSAGGCKLHLDAPEDAARLRPGVTVALELDVDGDGAVGPVQGNVLRSDPGAATVAIAFDGCPPELGRRVDDEVAAAELDDAPRVIVVDRDDGRRARLAGVLRAAGLYVAEATTPLETITLMQEEELHPWVIAIADAMPDDDADDLRGYLAEIHPGIEIVGVAIPEVDDVADATPLYGPDALDGLDARVLALIGRR